MARFMDVHNGFARPCPPGHMSSPVCWLSFPRIIDVPFEICVAVLESWQRTGQGGELHIGPSLLRWPIEHDRDCGTCRIEVGLARGPLRPPLRMRLEIDRWSPPSSRTALELIPCQRVRPTAAYLRSGHLLLDSLTHSLLQHWPAQRLGRVTATQLHVHQYARAGGRAGDEPATSAIKSLACLSCASSITHLGEYSSPSGGDFRARIFPLPARSGHLRSSWCRS
jgi:hypothetical protein